MINNFSCLNVLMAYALFFYKIVATRRKERQIKSNVVQRFDVSNIIITNEEKV